MSHESSNEGYRVEMENQYEIVAEIMDLLAKIIEQKDLPPDQIASMRSQLQANLNALGVDGLEDPKLRDMMVDFYRPDANLKQPKGYPSFEDFNTRLEAIQSEVIPMTEKCKQDPNVSALRQNGRLSFDEISARGGASLAHYLYDLGIVIANERAYEFVFKDDPISINEDWKVENGRHRTASLKAMPDEFIYSSGLNNWVKIELEK